MAAPRFLADAMLGRLARWLRVIGMDTLQLAIETPDAILVAIADAEDRVLLTRDRHLVRELRPKRSMLVTHDAPLAQLDEVIARFEIARPTELLTRCLVCNTELIAVARDEAGTIVPPSARGLPGPFRSCPACARVYWRGSHVRRMEAALASALPAWF